MATGVGWRIRECRRALIRLDADWAGTDAQFTEFFLRIVDQMPDQIKRDMKRFYVEGETQKKSPETGRPIAKDSRFYLNLVQGRNILATYIRAAQNDPRPMKLLEQVYGIA